MAFENFEILNLLEENSNNAVYKVRHKLTKVLYVWKAINSEIVETDDKKQSAMNKRMKQDHANLITFTIIENKLIYLSNKFLKNNNLYNFIKNTSKKDNVYLGEELVCKIIYQIVLILKTVEIFEEIDLHNLFLDDNFNVKFRNFQLSTIRTPKIEIKMSNIGYMGLQLCTLQASTNLSNFMECNNLMVYSEDLKMLLNTLLRDHKPVCENIDNILCHPTILLKSSRWTLEKNFQVRNGFTDKNNTDIINEYSNKLNKLRSREATLKIYEQKLDNRELNLKRREKKIALMERTVRDKLLQAELYLKRCRETKTLSSGSNNIKNDKMDSSFSACEQSIIIETSKKLNLETINKPVPFVKKFSERKIRFKAHSPLKTIDINKQKPFHRPKNAQDLPTLTKTGQHSEGGLNLQSIINQLPKSISRKGNFRRNKAKVLFSDVPISSLCKSNSEEIAKDCEPISWTEENKKCAFDLLRFMNSAISEDNYDENVKQTYL